MQLTGEALILMNTLFNIVILQFVGRVLQMDLNRLLLILCAFLSSVSAIVFFPTVWSIIISYLILMIPSVRHRHFWTSAIILWITVFFVGGMLSFIQQTMNWTASLAAFWVMTTLALFLLLRFTRRWYLQRTQTKFIRQINLQLFNEEWTLQGYIDTGNSCTEVFSGKPVHFLRYETIKNKIEPSIQDALFQWDPEQWMDVSMFPTTLQQQIRQVPFQTVTTNAMMLVFPCAIRLSGENRTFEHYVAFSKQSTYFPEKSSLLLHVSMIN